MIYNVTFLITLIQNVDWITINSNIDEYTISKEILHEWMEKN